MKGLCPYRAIASFPISQGVALGWRLIAPSGRYRKDADNDLNNNKPELPKLK
jgi:hypothetical protein